jgi:hypothetical protein
VAKVVKLDPIDMEIAVQTNDNLLSGLLKNELNIMKEGMDSLSPMNRREQRTLEVITTCNQFSRLACQARVMGEGVIIEMQSGTYVNQIDDVESLIGRRAEQNILHPLTGAVLVEAGKLITRTMITQLKDTKGQVSDYLAQTKDA